MLVPHARRWVCVIPGGPADWSFRSRLSNETIDPEEWLILGLIVVNTAAVALGTVDDIQHRYGHLLWAIEHVAVAVFTVEFAARVLNRLGSDTPTHRDPYLLVDLVAILPFYVGLVTGVGSASGSVVRILRVFKFARYVSAFTAIERAVTRKRDELVVSALGAAVLLFVAAAAMYFAERGAQPDAFGNIPAALWWSGITMTTVGYGDVYPVTTLGRIIGLFVSFLGIGIAAVPASILVSGFVSETRDGLPEPGADQPNPDGADQSKRCRHCGRRFDD